MPVPMETLSVFRKSDKIDKNWNSDKIDKNWNSDKIDKNWNSDKIDKNASEYQDITWIYLGTEMLFYVEWVIYFLLL